MPVIRNLLPLLIVLAASLQSEAIRITFGPYLQQVGPMEAVVVWGTDTRGVSWAEIAPDDSLHFYAEERPKFYETHLGRKVIGTLHKVKIDRLTPGVTYRYRIFTQEVTEESSYQVSYGKVASTRVYKHEPLRFTTVDPSKRAIRFSVVNDIHADTTRMARLLSGIGRNSHDFVLFNGDMVSHMDTEQQIVDGFIGKASDMFASEVPFYMIRGNHEGRGQFAANFPKYFPTATGMPYYSFRSGPVFFVVLDGGEDKPDSDIEYFGLNQMDRYREDEAEWLKTVVDSDEFRSAPFRVAVVHVPPYGDSWHGNLHSQELFLPILNSANIDLMLCGHLHKHVWLPAGKTKAAFPILINSNMDRVDVAADDEKIDLKVVKVDGSVTKHLTFPRR